ncbi:MAG: 50S ribosomal protein L3 [Candidatus Levybacteria bacterium]|nr:50S ribosomal protein L3 [Candidatus Levybacteria bacterium]
MNGLIGIKKDQSQKFLENGTRVPVTQVMTGGVLVSDVKTKEKNGYTSVQLCMGFKKAGKALLGQVKGGDKAPRFFREIRLKEGDQVPNIGDSIKVLEVFKPGDIVDVSGVSKGKGYAGVVKRHHFKGGPRTHGQSDRERAPGSIGQTTTPGRVYKGKRMAGRMGNENVTMKNLKVIDVLEDSVLIEGLVPGSKNSLVVIKKVGEDKKFVPLYEEEEKPAITEDAEKKTESTEGSVKVPEGKVQTESKEEKTEEVKEESSSAEAMEDKENVG